jgi:hypothetical protein
MAEAYEERGAQEREPAAGVVAQKNSSRSAFGPAVYWFIAGAAVLLVIAGVFAVLPREAKVNAVEVGDVVRVQLTLIVSDSIDVECSYPMAVEGYHCGYVDEKTAAAGPEAQVLRPFMSVDRKLYLIAGLFTHPALRQRLDSEPMNGPRDSLKRFTATCELKRRGAIDGFRLHWVRSDPWSEAQRADVMTVENCFIEQ